ncbi:MAG: hypothetical protein V1912_10395 [bacterium]
MTREILVVVEGGLVQDICGIPPDVVVRVRDYDVEGCAESQLSRDHDGALCHEYVMAHEDSCPLPGT